MLGVSARATRCENRQAPGRAAWRIGGASCAAGTVAMNAGRFDRRSNDEGSPAEPLRASRRLRTLIWGEAP